MESATMNGKQPMPGWMKAGALTAAGLGAGAALMYLIDPNRGRARRSQLCDQAMSLAREAGGNIEKRLLDCEHRIEGAVAQVRHALTPEVPVSDRKVEARVHTRLGRSATRPRGIRVMAVNGEVILGGAAPANEIDAIVDTVAATPGVKGVKNMLTVTA